MINRNLLQSTISKYFLGDLHKSVKWRIKDNTLTVYAQSEGLVCKTLLNKFPVQDSEIGVFDTDKLVKLLSITNGDLLMSLSGNKALKNVMYIEDANFNLTYTLADPLAIGKTSWVTDPEFDVELDLSDDDISHLIKAKGALDATSVLIKTTENLNGTLVCEFMFSPEAIEDNYSNKISYQIQGNIKEEGMRLPFNALKFSEILKNNKDMTTAKLFIANSGMMKMEFTSEHIESTYYLLRNELN
jgi:hypothetical protein